jgi:hypothetical protein
LAAPSKPSAGSFFACSSCIAALIAGRIPDVSLGKELAVSFDGEDGIDAGGLLKSWLSGVTEKLVVPGELLLPVIYKGATTCLRLNPIPSETGLDEASVMQRLRLLGVLIGTSLVRHLHCCSVGCVRCRQFA